MKLDELKQLQALVEAKYQVRQQAFKSLLARENTLREDLRRLENQKYTSQYEDTPGMRAIGADVIWNAWLGKAKASLNMRLALVLAEKEQHIRQVQQAFGNVIVTKELIERQASEIQKKENNLQLKQAINQSIS